MRPNPSPSPDRSVLLMTAGLWLLVFVLYTLRSLASDLPFWPQMLPRLLACTGGALICVLLYYMLRPFEQRGLGVQLPLTVGLSLLGGAGDALLSYGINQWLIPELQPPATEPFLIRLTLNAQAYSWLFLTWCCVYLTFSYSRRLRDNQLRLLETQALAADAQNRMLRYQINPHFLFNTLNALSSLVLHRRNERAEQMLMALSSFLRYSLARSPDELVPLREEAQAQEEYLRIEQARFGERLTFVNHVDPEVAHVEVPSLILQPLVENAVKYAVAPSAAPVTLEITARRRDDGCVVVEVLDDGAGLALGDPGLGVGLENVRRRLEVVYGGRASFAFGARQPRGFAATLVLPADRAS